MRTRLIICLLFLTAGMATAQNIPAPDIANAAGQIANAGNAAAAQAAQTALIRQQTALLKQQAELLKRQTAQATDTSQPPRRFLTEDGNAFLAQCGNSDTASIGCGMYVGGVIDGRGLSDKPGFCLPDHVSYEQMLRVSVKYMQDHPESLHVPTYLLVILAHAQAFSCRAETKQQ
jgi:hypothetical protein